MLKKLYLWLTGFKPLHTVGDIDYCIKFSQRGFIQIICLQGILSLNTYYLSERELNLLEAYHKGEDLKLGYSKVTGYEKIPSTLKKTHPDAQEINILVNKYSEKKYTSEEEFELMEGLMLWKELVYKKVVRYINFIDLPKEVINKIFEEIERIVTKYDKN